MLQIAIAIVMGYLIGSIPTGYLHSKSQNRPRY